MLPPSTSLDWYLGYLHAALHCGSKMPMWDGIKFAESPKFNSEGEVENLGNLIDFKDYYDRFTELVTCGRTWINLYPLGLLNGNLILSIEVPDRDPEGVSQTSVNMSGLTMGVEQNNFNIRFANNNG